MTSTAKRKVILAREKKNEKLKHISLEMLTSTHFPLLIQAVQLTKGPVLEVGSGLFSTPLLHWLCFDKRMLVTLESYRHYMEFAEKFRTSMHEVLFVRDWGLCKMMPPEKRWSVVFIDHSPKRPMTRGDEAIKYKDLADYVILHDAGENSMPKYGYEKVYPHFKYRHDWTGCFPHTTILSNFHDLHEFKS